MFSVDKILNIISKRDRIDATGLHTVQIGVSTTDAVPQTDEDLIVREMESARVSTTHAQLNANARNIDRKGSMDDAHSLTEAFWFGTEVSSIRNVVLRFKIDPLRSTIKTVAGSSTTTNSGGGSTSGSGGATTQSSTTTTPAHSHNIDFDTSTSTTYIVANSSNNGFATNPAQPSPAALPTSNNVGGAHSHSVSIPDHTHTTPNHTHTLTPNITTTYGIFEESAGNTLGQSDIIIKINGVTYTGSVDSIAGGWYQAEITSYLVDIAGFPNQANNAIEYSTSTAKTAQITTSLAIVDIVQAISIL